ncbi:flagellar motor protein MotB [Clostridium omnivorum]|uniref:Chemotaxis protein MotB n=1 Tax=Clostridium omnivorum TaxID=1604902 RepID=A0ABQ5N678_9CLOT|nr:flagellar motor protein MotB [Clostridium sp. E14]GLC30750.1 chemotaxis protein MotB [Clostridium sp. E14]
MRRKKREEGHDNNERWLLTYSDLITLLMIFFIVMYSMSNLDKQKYQQIASGLNKAMGSGGGKNIIGVDKGVAVDQDWQPTNTEVVQAEEKSKLEEVKKQVDQYLQQNGLSQSVDTKVEERGLVLSFKDSLFFDSGQADIKTDEVKKLVDIGKILNMKAVSDNYIRVEGHTDNVPISTYQYKSNWDLSVIRASNVAQLLIAQSGIVPQRVSALGYGEFRPIADNNTVDGKARNRRVDIIIMSSKYNEVENNKQ